MDNKILWLGINQLQNELLELGGELKMTIAQFFRANGGSTEVTGRLILRVNDLPAGGKLTLSAAEYHLAKAALNQLRTQRLAEGGYTDAVDDALIRLLHAHTPLFIW